MNARELVRRGIIQGSFRLAIVAMLCSAPAASAQQSPTTSPEDIASVSAANRAFAIDLYKQAARDNPQLSNNLVLSPFSISSTLIMAAEGARGRTADQMNFALYLSDALRPSGRADEQSSGVDLGRIHAVMKLLTSQFNTAPSRAPTTAPTTAPSTLAVSNALWVEQSYPLNAAYVQTIERAYGMNRVNPADFHNRPDPSRLLINLAVASQTQQKIKELLSPSIITSETRMVLTNAVYFKGNWVDSFPKNGTAKRIFRQDNTHDTQTMLMHDPAMDLPYFENDDLQAIALPYVGGGVTGQDLCLVVLLPKRVDGLTSLESSLLSRRVDEWFGAMIIRKVDTYLPRFKSAAKLDLVRTLTTLGMRDAFSSENANFSGISPAAGADHLYLNSVEHQASVDVDESGAEAVASTAAVSGALGGSTSIQRTVRLVTFRADHPFIFMVYHNPTGSILFIGRVTNPAV